MKPNVVIDGIYFKTTMPVKVGANLLYKVGANLLYHDFPLTGFVGVATRDLRADEILNPKNTKDVILKMEKIISKSPPSHPLSVLDLGKTTVFDPEANKGSVSLEPAREPDADPP